MGADIHIIAEVKESGKWRLNTDKIFKNSYYKPEEKDKPKDEQWHWALEEFQVEPSDGRSYDWFAILANVRNGRGFAGIKTGQGFDVIAEPKGLPEDLSSDALKYFSYRITDDKELEDGEDLDGTYFVLRESGLNWVNNGYSEFLTIDNDEYVSNPDYHSQSYLDVNDFDNFDWNQVTMKYGVISLDQYKLLKDSNNAPEDWSGEISGQNIITISTDVADKILDGKNIELKKDLSTLFSPNAGFESRLASEWDAIYVEYEWSVLYSDWFSDKIKNIIEPLRQLSQKYEDARLVFAFDN